MNVVCFDYNAKYGHFLRAEANANGVSYPVPPRTALLGLIAAVLGLPKDALAGALATAHIAVAGAVPHRFWHKTNVRKDPSAPLSWQIKKTDKGSSSEQRNFRFPQEWLWEPRYRVWAALPEARHAVLAGRLRDHQWYFTPCMGLSEMLADVEFVYDSEARPLPMDSHLISSVAPRDSGAVDTSRAADAGLTLQSLRMPSSVTGDRIFGHRNYWIEHGGRPFPFETALAYRCGEDTFAFL